MGGRREAGFTAAWRTKSLLATFAVLAYLDLTDGKRVLACGVCGRPFVSGAYQARYCSAGLNTAMKRAYRQRGRRRERGAAAEDDPPVVRGLASQ